MGNFRATGSYCPRCFGQIMVKQTTGHTQCVADFDFEYQTGKPCRGLQGGLDALDRRGMLIARLNRNNEAIEAMKLDLMRLLRDTAKAAGELGGEALEHVA